VSRDEIMYLQDIAESCRKILRFTEGLARADLMGDEKTYDAVVRNLEIIGEAAKHVSEPVREQLPQVDWRKAGGLRDMLAHAYFGIDEEILWDVVHDKVPQLAKVVNAFLSKNHNRRT